MLWHPNPASTPILLQLTFRSGRCMCSKNLKGFPSGFFSTLEASLPLFESGLRAFLMGSAALGYSPLASSAFGISAAGSSGGISALSSSALGASA